MKYTINTAVLGSGFLIPAIVADQFLKIATAAQLKVLIYFMRNISEAIDAEKIASVLSLPTSEVEDALFFWSQNGLLNSEQPKQTEPKAVIIKSTMPTRADVIKRGLEDKNLMFLLREAQLIFGRNLKQNESQLLVSLYDDHGMDGSVILLLLNHCAKAEKCTLSYIKNTASAWLKAGVETVQDAEKIMAEATKQNLAWDTVRKAFGIEYRKPSAKEQQLCDLWINEWKLSNEELKAAYDACIDSSAKFNMTYIAKVIENSRKGVDKPQKAKASTGGKTTTQNTPGFDLIEYEEMLNKKIKKGGNSSDA